MSRHLGAVRVAARLAAAAVRAASLQLASAAVWAAVREPARAQRSKAERRSYGGAGLRARIGGARARHRRLSLHQLVAQQTRPRQLTLLKLC